MRTHSKLKKFFLICAAVFVVGLGCAIGGAACGGLQDMNKLGDRYDWIHTSPGERGVTAQKVKDFHSIEATGDADLWIVGESFYKRDSWLAEQEVLEQTELDVLGKNKVCVICGDRIEQPEISVKNGVLKINSAPVEMDGIILDLTDDVAYPQILVCVPDETLKSLTVSGETGDVDLLGISWKNARVLLNYGDLEAKAVKSESLTAKVDSGDVEVRGNLKGTTDVTVESGDIELRGRLGGITRAFTGSGDIELKGILKGKIRTASDSGDIELKTDLPKDRYGLKVRTMEGDIEMLEAGRANENYEDFRDILEEGGPHKINAKTEFGDIELSFEDSRAAAEI